MTWTQQDLDEYTARYREGAPNPFDRDDNVEVIGAYGLPLTAEPVTVRRGKVSAGDDVAGVKLFTGPIEPAQTESFRGLVERVSARLHEETRRDIMAGLARAGRRHHGAIL